MKTTLTLVTLFLLNVTAIFSQTVSTQDKPNDLKSGMTLKMPHESNNKLGLNLMFSDNGFGLGTTFYKQLSTNISGFAGISISSAKDGREFEQVDIFGNTNTPYKVNRLFMVPLNIGIQARLFRSD